MLGVACMIVAPERSSARRSAVPSRASAADTRTVLPPTLSGRNSSRTEISKDAVVTDSSTSPASRPGLSRIASRKFTTLRCSTCTPLGCPVEPDV